MTTKEDIERVIKERIDRFNRLWIKAVGYSFEEEPEILNEQYEKDMAEWQPKANARAKELGFETDEDYLNYCWDNHINYEDRDVEMNRLWQEKPNTPSPLIHYEMNVINQAKSIALYFIDKYGENYTEKWDELIDNCEKDSFKFVELLKEDGYDGWDDGHSGNSGSMSVSFAHCLLFDPELFQYMHGALCMLVGDKGYYDDRSDLPDMEEYRKNKEEKEKKEC